MSCGGHEGARNGAGTGLLQPQHAAEPRPDLRRYRRHSPRAGVPDGSEAQHSRSRRRRRWRVATDVSATSGTLATIDAVLRNLHGSESLAAVIGARTVGGSDTCVVSAPPPSLTCQRQTASPRARSPSGSDPLAISTTPMVASRETSSLCFGSARSPSRAACASA